MRSTAGRFEHRGVQRWWLFIGVMTIVGVLSQAMIVEAQGTPPHRYKYGDLPTPSEHYAEVCQRQETQTGKPCKVSAQHGNSGKSAPTAQAQSAKPSSSTVVPTAPSPGANQQASIANHRLAAVPAASQLAANVQSPTTKYNWSQVSTAPTPPATTSPVFPSPRDDPAMAYDAWTGNTVLFGGNDPNDNALGDTWTWVDNSTGGGKWTEQYPSTSPLARENAMMAYDSATTQIVLFGGIGFNPSITYLNDMWTWNGYDWTEVCSSCAPSARWGAGFAYDDSNLHALVLFGGFGGTGGPGGSATDMNDTWTWNGSWTQHAPPDQPPSRDSFSMAYDSSDNAAVIFGGVGALGTGSNDTWEYNGSDWVSMGYGGPPPRYLSGMAFNQVDAGVNLIGGDDGYGNALADNWQWTGQWKQVNPEPNLTGRQDFGIANDVANDKLVVFGGLASTGWLNDTWVRLNSSQDGMIYRGGSIWAPQVNVFIILWAPYGHQMPDGQYSNALQAFVQTFGGTSIYKDVLNTYYMTDRGGANTYPAKGELYLSGLWTDTRPYPDAPVITSYGTVVRNPQSCGYNCLSDQGISNEVSYAISQNSSATPSWSNAAGNIYLVYTGSGEDVCSANVLGFGTQCSFGNASNNDLCGYHWWTAGGGTSYGAIVYPSTVNGCTLTRPPTVRNPNGYDSTVDGAVSITSHELSETITDPGLRGWCGANGWVPLFNICGGDEVGDRCNTAALDVEQPAGSYDWYIQEEWSNYAGGCAK